MPLENSPIVGPLLSLDVSQVPQDDCQALQANATKPSLIHTKIGPVDHTVKATPLLSTGIKSAITPPPSVTEAQPANPIIKRNTKNRLKLLLTAHTTAVTR